MITLKIITVIYWLLLLSVVISGLTSLFRGEIFAGLGIIIFGAIGVRIWSELLIVLFKINENIQRLADK